VSQLFSGISYSYLQHTINWPQKTEQPACSATRILLDISDLGIFRVVVFPTLILVK